MSHSFKSSVFPAVNGKIVNISIYLIPKSIIYRYSTLIKTENSLNKYTQEQHSLRFVKLTKIIFCCAVIVPCLEQWNASAMIRNFHTLQQGNENCKIKSFG